MSHAFDVYWSFRSPFCYLALDRILAMRRGYDVAVNVRPVYPIAIRTPDFFKTVSPLRRAYHTRDSKRVAESLGIPLRRPVPDPIIQDDETNAIADEQPYIFRLTRLGMAAADAGRGLDFLDQVSRMIWDGSVDNWHVGDHLADAIGRAGLDFGALDRRATEEPERLDSLIEENQSAHRKAGHWGVPTMVFEGEPFYGQDRLDLLLWRMKQRGLKERA